MKGFSVDMNIEWRKLRQVLERYAEYFIELSRRELLQNNTNASGALTNSFRSKVIIDHDRYEVWIELEDYWKYIEYGRKPGKFPPLNKIKEWIRVKPVHPHTMTLTRVWYTNGRRRGEPKTIRNERKYQALPTTDQLAYLIGRKIAEKGTDPQPFFNKAKEDAYNYFRNAIDYAIAEDVENWIIEKADIQGMLNDLFK